MKEFPDITGLLERKEARRRELAALPFEEKIAILMRLRERRRFLRNGIGVVSGSGAEVVLRDRDEKPKR